MLFCQKSTIESLVQSGDELYRSGKYHKAIAKYDKAIKIIDNRIYDSIEQLKFDIKHGNYSSAYGSCNAAIQWSVDKVVATKKRSNTLILADNLSAACHHYSDQISKLKSDIAEICFYRGRVLSKLDQNDFAISNFSQAIEYKTEYAEAYYQRGLLVDDKERALGDFDKAIEYKPEYAEAYYQRGLLVDDNEKARIDFDKAIEYKPEYAEAYYQRGLLVDDKEKALSDFDKAIAYKPEYAEAYYQRGYWLYCTGGRESQEKALADFEKFVALPVGESQKVEAYYYLGKTYCKLKKLEKAVECFQKAIKINPEYHQSYKARGDCNYDLKKYQDAVDDYSQAYDRSQDVKILLDRGDAYSEQNKFDAAISDYLEVAQEDKSKRVEAYRKLSDTYAKKDEYDRAVEKINKSIDSFDESTKYSFGFFKRAQIHMQFRNYQGAIDSFTEAIKSDKFWLALDVNEDNSGLAEAYLGRGLAWHYLGNQKNAIADYNRATQAKTDYVLAYFYWGITYEENGQIQEALEQYKKAIEVDENHPYAHNNIAQYYWKKGNYREGLKEWENARSAYSISEEFNQDNSSHDDYYFLYYGNMLHELFGELDEAEKQYQNGLSINSKNPELLMALGDLYNEKISINRYKNVQSHQELKELNIEEQKSSLCRVVQKKYSDAFDQYQSDLNKSNLRTEKKYTCIDLDHRSTFIASNNLSIIRTLANLGELSLKREDYQQAENDLLLAVEKYHALEAQELNQKSISEGIKIRLHETEKAKIHANLGLTYIRLDKKIKGVKELEKAHKTDPVDLTIWSNLAEAYLKIGQQEAAEVEFRRILKVAYGHFDSYVGLAETYVEMAAEEPDFYSQAIKYFNQAIDFEKTRTYPERSRKLVSKRVNDQELATVYYSRGYVKSKLFEGSSFNKDFKQIDDALADFRECRRYDSEHHKAERAIAKISKAIAPLQRQERNINLVSNTIFYCSLLVFGFSQIAFWIVPVIQAGINKIEQSMPVSESIDISQEISVDSPFFSLMQAQNTDNNTNSNTTPTTTPTEESQQNDLAQSSEKNSMRLDGTLYSVLTFTSMVFMIISFFLPQLSKLSVAGIQIEKSTVDQLRSVGSLGIKR